jgi:hypothetical protein
LNWIVFISDNQEPISKIHLALNSFVVSLLKMLIYF